MKYECILCDATFPKESSLKRHIQVHFAEEPCKVIEHEDEMVLEYDDVLENTEDQSLTFDDYPLMQNEDDLHIQEFTITTSTSEEDFNSMNIKTEPTDENYAADHFLTEVTKEKPILTCPQCEYSTDVKSRMARHSLIHTGIKMFKCTQCSYESVYNFNLKVHMQVHLKGKQFKCPYCKLQYKHKIDLQRHSVVHKGPENLYKCFICNIKFTIPRSLKIHNDAVHGTGLGKVLQCPYCDYKTMWHRGSLNSHILSHTKEKRFKCAQCDYATAYKSSFNTHMRRSHSKKQKGFECTICEQIFTSVGKLKKHVESHVKAE